MNRLILFLITLLSSSAIFAHEPIYGLGPETLPKHLHAIELGSTFKSGELEYDLSYAFGITQNWTARVEVSTLNSNNNFDINRLYLKTKYALWRKTEPGVLKRLTAIAAVSFPTNNRIRSPIADVKTVTIGIANGYESRRWYYFSDVGYTYSWANLNDQVGGRMNYNLVGGIRHVKSGYLKPDLVILVELNGELKGKSFFASTNQELGAGNTLAFAPGFLLSYRNLMFKAGIQFGIANTKNIDAVQRNGLMSIEYHF